MNKEDYKNEQGCCPKCGGFNLDYQPMKYEDSMCYYRYKCEDCGQEGEEWNKFAEWEKNNDVIAREVRIYKCNKIDYGFNADDELELDRQIVNWEGEPNQKFDEFINDEVEKRFGITYEDDGYYEKYDEVQDEIAHKYLDKRAEGLVDFINDFGGDYTATLREYTASDCESLGMTVEELREYAENERVFIGGLR